LLTDIEIVKLLKEPKILPSDFVKRIIPKPKRGHKEIELNFKGINNSEYAIILRQSLIEPLKFSAILAYQIPKSNQRFRLRRYNGKHQHTNKIERIHFFDYHIHQATERYQLLGVREDTYAEPSNRFSNLNEAVNCLLEDCNFNIVNESQTSLLLK